MYLVRCAIIFSILTFANCEETEANIIKLPVNVYIDQSNNTVFEFETNQEIEPISLREGEVIFSLSKNNKTINFRDPRPVNMPVKVTLEYRYSGKKDIKTRNFEHVFRNKFKDAIIIYFPKPTAARVPRKQICSSQSCGNTDSDLPAQPLNEWPDVPLKSNKEPYSQTFIDKETLEESCESDYGYAEELLNTALRHSKMGTHLLLKGVKDTKANPVDTIRTIIFEELDLPHLEYRILQAKNIDGGLLFEMETTKDVVEILRQAETKWEAKKSVPRIESTAKTIFDNDNKNINFDIRIAV